MREEREEQNKLNGTEKIQGVKKIKSRKQENIITVNYVARICANTLVITINETV